MDDISDDQFHQLMNEAMDSLPKTHIDRLKNVAILLEEDVSPELRASMQLPPDRTLLGLYNGVPLARRQGELNRMPDTITLFKRPLLHSVGSLDQLKEQIRHTLWHEIAHYYGLDHDKIRELE
jgi:predicted Zn-dependent protease with MMP-like domain